MPAAQDILDPVTSPETPVAVPSPAAQTTPEANPTPTGGETPASPAASDKVKAPTPVLGEQDVLDRLSPPIEKPKSEPSVPAVKAEGEVAPEGAAPETPADETESDEYVPYTDAEGAKYHSKTRRRFKQLDSRIKEMEPYANFASNIARSAAENEVPIESVQKWLDIGFQVRRGDPQALAAMQNLIASHGVVTEAAAPDVSGVTEILEKLHRSLDISDEAKERIEAALTRAVPKAEKKPAPVAPQQRQAPPQPQGPSPIRQTASWVQSQEARYAQQLGPKWPAVKAQIYAEAARREAQLPANLVNDPLELRVRFAACAEHVLTKASQKAPVVSVQPTLRAVNAPSSAPTLKRGTPEYEDALLSGTLP
jgi:hypothetical protein